MIKTFDKFINESASSGVNTFKLELTDNYPEDIETLADVLERASKDIREGKLENYYKDLAVGYEVVKLDEWGEPVNLTL